MRIKEWNKWQTFRKDRGTPPWIKVYRNLFSNPEWVNLSDSEKGQLVSIWILGADKHGRIPDDAKTIQKMCMLDEAPNLSRLMDLGFLVGKKTPTGNHKVTTSAETVPVVTNQSRVEESRVEESKQPCQAEDLTLADEKKEINQNLVLDNALIIFQHWQKVMNHPKAVFDKKRRGKINDRMKDGYSFQSCIDAINGCKGSPNHQGQNERKMVYDRINLIFRDAEHMDSFISIAKNGLPEKNFTPRNPREAQAIQSDQIAKALLQDKENENRINAGEEGSVLLEHQVQRDNS